MGVLAASITGIDQITRIHISVGHGDSVFITANCLPQFGIPPANVDVAITDGAETLILPGCRIDRANIVYSTSGQIVRVQILGPTWRWRFGCIDGVYNVVNPDGTVVSTTRKSVQELAALLFDAMHVSSYDVSGLPNVDGPFVNWNGANAFAELTALCHAWGCDFGLDVQGPVARVWQMGVGPALPSGGSERTIGYGMDLTELPDVISVRCGPTLVQSKIKLEPVGRDTDGSIKHRDDLSYFADGWEDLDPFDPLGADENQELRRLAKEAMLMWRAVSQADGSQVVPGFGPVNSIEDILPILPYLSADYQNDNGVFYRQRPYLVGVFAKPSATAIVNTDDDEQCEVEFTLDYETGILRTAVPIYKLDAARSYAKAELYLVCAYQIRSSTTYSYHHYALSRTIASNDTGEYCTHRPELQLRVIAEYSGTTVSGVTTNQAAIDAALNQHLDAIQIEFQAVSSVVVEYAGLVAIRLSGATRQTMFSINCDEPRKGCFTTAAQNTEWEPGLLRRWARRRDADGRRPIREVQDTQRRHLERRGAL